MSEQVPKFKVPTESWLLMDDQKMRNLGLVNKISWDSTGITFYYTGGTTELYASGGTSIAFVAFKKVQQAMAQLALVLDLQLTVTAITPDPTGPTTGGTAIQIKGNGFTNEGTETLTIGGTNATSFSFIDQNTLQAITPAGTAGAQDVVYTDASGIVATLAGGFTYV